MIQRLSPSLLGLGATLLVASMVLAQSSANFDLRPYVHVGGGGERQSANFLIQDTLGQTAAGVATSANSQIESGFWGAFSASASGPAAGDSFEEDDTCGGASVINTTGAKQAHTFHDAGDRDWIRFTAQANKTYVIEVTNVGTQADAIVILHDACGQPPASQGSNSFGSTVRLEWDSTKSGDYFLEIQQFDPTFFGADASYEVSVTIDSAPPSAPQNVRCIAISETTLGLQWKKSPERDVRSYRINFTGNISGSEDVAGGDTTYYELGNLTPNQTYLLRVVAVDFSSNESTASGQVQCTASTPEDLTTPSLSLHQPSNSEIYTTTAFSLTFTGLALDSGNNLSRVNVRNVTRNVEGWDYSLVGGSDDFRVESLGVGVGNNNIRVTVYDAAGNSSQRNVTVRRLGNVVGAVIIVAGHNETFGLQTNIYNAANRAYRIFQSAGYSDENIYYISPAGQDADGNGTIDTDAASSPAAIQNAITTWAQEGGRVGPGKPLFLYMIDHGFGEKFCASGCGVGQVVTPPDLNTWLDVLEDATGVNQVNVVIEACQSGSFIDRPGGDVTSGLGKTGRVIITSTGADNNAYASADGAYFSDAFFSCAADSGSIKACFDQASAAVATTGVNQTPWLDDNGDGLFDAGDGTVAQNRYVTNFFSSIRPEIGAVSLTRSADDGLLTATVLEGAEEVALVWATVFPPGFQEPSDVTLNLNVPTVRLDPDPNTPGRYSFNYTNGFAQDGDYRIVFYAQDRLGIHALPRREGEPSGVFMPIISKN